MSKEEALEYLKPFRWEDKKEKEAYDILKKSLTPPTADEVCKALSDYYGKEVKVDKRYNNTTFVCDGRNIAWVDNNGSVQINQPKPPHLITLIGRFYEGKMIK